MKKQILLSITFVLFILVFGQSQNQEQNTEQNIRTHTEKSNLTNSEYLILREKFENKSTTNTSSKIYFTKSNGINLDPSNNWSNEYSFYNPVSGYTTITQKGKPIKGAKLSNAVSKGLNFWLKSN